MPYTYEIRFLNDSGEIAVFYATQYASDDHAREHITRMTDRRYARYELWRDGQKVGEGDCPAREV